MQDRGVTHPGLNRQGCSVADPFEAHPNAPTHSRSMFMHNTDLAVAPVQGMMLSGPFRHVSFRASSSACKGAGSDSGSSHGGLVRESPAMFLSIVRGGCLRHNNELG